MKIVLLCGGKGTRIRDVSSEVPKPMIPVGNYPIIWHIMKYYSLFGYKDFVLCLGYLGDVIRDFFINYQYRTGDLEVNLGKENSVRCLTQLPESDWCVTLAETGMNTMTGGRVRKIRQYVEGDDCFMLTYGDGVGDIDIDALLAFHRSHGKVLTVTGVRPPGRFGELRYDESGLVTGFNEKPQATAGRISGGYFVCNKAIFNYLDDTDDLVFEQEPMARLVKDQQFAVYEHDGFWQPMDTHREYLLLNEMCSAGNAPWMKWHAK